MSVNFKADIKPISYIKTNAADMMKYINETHSPIVITQNGEARAVLLDIESYQNMENAFTMLGMIRLAEKDIKNGKVKSADEVFADLKNRLGKAK
ncbi:MAG: type II toxin-antitoxin system Phd/YefM family antitoxin [Candidatus Omnitrophota bacterium]|jgi:prevent-host-death family protein